jgi:hypothetical protein
MQQAAYTTFGNNGSAGPSTSWNMPFDDGYDTSEPKLSKYFKVSFAAP